MLPFEETKGQVQQLSLLIPVRWEAKVGRLLEPGSSRPGWATEQDPVSKKRKDKRKKEKKPTMTIWKKPNLGEYGGPCGCSWHYS